MSEVQFRQLEAGQSSLQRINWQSHTGADVEIPVCPSLHFYYVWFRARSSQPRQPHIGFDVFRLVQQTRLPSRVQQSCSELSTFELARQSTGRSTETSKVQWWERVLVCPSYLHSLQRVLVGVCRIEGRSVPVSISRR